LPASPAESSCHAGGVGANDVSPVFVLVHSPLLGPATWRPVARRLAQRQRRAIVPSLLGIATAPLPRWRSCVEAAAKATEGLENPVILVAHSGSGPLLPAIGAGVPAAVAAMIFVDAALPALGPTTELAPPETLARLRDRAVDGLLPRWSTWFEEDLMRELLPDQADRAAVERELPTLPVAYFEETVPNPDGWDRVPCAYLRLSQAYDEAAADASRRGWRAGSLDGHHLSIVAAPNAVADALIRLAEPLFSNEA
jgi:pimeloyl-ACP methyl ester carboxylesterase